MGSGDPFAADDTGVHGDEQLAARLKQPTRAQGEREGEDVGQRHEHELPESRAMSLSDFAVRDFDPSSFLLERRHTPLDELRSELRAHLSQLRASLVQVINDDYQDFIGLSLGLRRAGVQHALEQVRAPVLALERSVKRTQAELVARQEHVDDLLERRRRVRLERAMLKRLIDVDDALDKVERMLDAVRARHHHHLLLHAGASPSLAHTATATTAHDGDAEEEQEDSPVRRLERLSAEYTHMLYLARRASSTDDDSDSAGGGGGAAAPQPFVAALQPRIDKASERLLSLLDAHLEHALSPPSSSSSSSTTTTTGEREATLTAICDIYKHLSHVPRAEDVVRHKLVRPFVRRAIQRDALHSTRPSSQGADATANGTTENDNDDDAAARQDARLVSALERPAEGTYAHFEIDALRRVYNAVLEFVNDACAPILRATDYRDHGDALAKSKKRKEGEGETDVAVVAARRGNGTADDGQDDEGREGNMTGAQYAVLANVIWTEVGEALMSQLGSVIFAAGRPVLFHQNYVLAIRFLAKFESLCQTSTMLDTLRRTETYASFMRRFQLPVYFQLRLKEVTSMLAREIQNSNLNSSNSSSSSRDKPFVLQETRATFAALEFCARDDVFVPDLVDRFWRLFLQIISRYRSWLDSVVPSYIPPSSSNANLSASGANTTRSSFEGGRDRLSASNAPSRPGTPAPSGGDDLASEETSLRRLTLLVADAHTLDTAVRRLFDDRVRTLLPSADGENENEDDDDSTTTPYGALQTSLALLHALVAPLSSHIVSLLTRRAAEPLKHAKLIAAQVRASPRHVKPSEPSRFVSGVLRDLHAFLRDAEGTLVDDETRRAWATAVVDEVALRYARILADQRAKHDSLRRIKKSGTAFSFFSRSSGAASANNSNAAAAGDDKDDDSRVALQMQLDVDALEQDARELGVDTAGRPAFQQLRSAIVVEPAK